MSEAPDPRDYTRGAPYIETQSYEEGDRGSTIHYLTPDGKRFRVTIDQSYDSPEIRERMGLALAEGKTGRRPQ